MSKEKALEFVQKMKEDDAFRAEVIQLGEDQDLTDFIRDKGYDFTTEELAEARSEIEGSAIADSELNQVAGGWCEGKGCSPSCYDRWH